MPSSKLDEATLAGGLLSLWGMQEQEGTTAGDVSGVPGRPSLTATQHGTGGELAMGTAGVMPEGVAALFTPDAELGAGNGITLDNADAQFYAGSDFSVFCQFAWSGSTGANLLRVGTPGMGSWARLRVKATEVVATVVRADGTTRELSVPASTTTGPHWVGLSVSGYTMTLYVDDDAEWIKSGTHVAGLGTMTGVQVGNVWTADPVQVAWAGFAEYAFDATRMADLALLATRGAERSDLRIARILRWLGVDPDADLEVGVADVAYQNMGGRGALDVIAEANDVERGLFHAAGDGRLVQHSRTHRYNDSPVIDVDASLVAPEPIAVDMTRLVNDYEVSRPYGSTYRARDEASIATYGQRTESATIYAASDDDLRDAAQAHLGLYAHPAPRWPRVQVDLLAADATTAAAVLDVKVGDLVRVSGLPATAPTTEVDLYVEGIADEMSATSWTVTWSTSPATYTAAWILDDTTYSVLGTTTILV